MEEERKPVTPTGVAPVSRARIWRAAVIAAMGGIAEVIRDWGTISKALSLDALRGVTVSPFAWFLDYGVWTLARLLFSGAIVYLFWANLANRVSRQSQALEARIDASISAQKDIAQKLETMTAHLANMTNYMNSLASRMDKFETRLDRLTAGILKLEDAAKEEESK